MTKKIENVEQIMQRQQDILTLGHLHENAVTRATIKLAKENPNFTDIDLDVAVRKEQQEMGLLPAVDLDEYRAMLEQVKAFKNQIKQEYAAE